MAIASQWQSWNSKAIWSNFKHVRPSFREDGGALKALCKWLAVTWESKNIYPLYILLIFPEELGCLTQDTNCDSVTLDSRSCSSSWLPWASVWLSHLVGHFVTDCPSCSDGSCPNPQALCSEQNAWEQSQWGWAEANWEDRQPIFRLYCLFEGDEQSKEDSVPWGLMGTFCTCRVRWGQYATSRNIVFRAPCSFLFYSVTIWSSKFNTP